jgi:hypothetical protein
VRALARLILALAVATGGVALAPRVAGAETAPNAADYEVKSAYLLNFARFVEWPVTAFADTTSALRIGFIGSSPLDPGFVRELESRKIHDRPVQVLWPNGPGEITSCHVVFVQHDAGPRIDEVLAGTRDRPILTVGDTTRFAARGGVIEFYLEDDNVRFEINTAAARRAGLVVSSRLLSLARLTPPAADRPTGSAP